MNFKKIVSLTLVSLTVLGTVSFTSASPSGGSSGVRFYQDAGLGGEYTLPIDEGTYTLDQLEKYGFKNDWASSVYIPEDYTVLMYENDDFNGIPWLLTQNDGNSRDFTKVINNISQVANDKVSSIRVSRGVCLYEDINFRGTHTNGISRPGCYLSPLKASSVTIPKGWSIYLYQESSPLNGECWFLTQNDENSRNFDKFGANDSVQSFRVYKGVVFFDQANCKGFSGGGLAPLEYTTADLAVCGIRDDWPSSVYIPEGYTVQIFDYDNFQGNNWTLDRNDKNSKDLNNIPNNNPWLEHIFTPTADHCMSSVKITRNY